MRGDGRLGVLDFGSCLELPGGLQVPAQGVPQDAVAGAALDVRRRLLPALGEGELGRGGLRPGEFLLRQGLQGGVAALGDFLAAEQAAGRLRAGLDPYATAMLFVGACYTRAAQRQMPARVAELPALEEVIGAFEALLAPA